jgi:hypothetical protein
VKDRKLCEAIWRVIIEIELNWMLLKSVIRGLFPAKNVVGGVVLLTTLRLGWRQSMSSYKVK